MSKIVNISEKKFMKVLRHIVTEETPSNYDPFADQIADKKKFSRLGTDYEAMEDGHGMIQNDVNNQMTAKGPNDGINNVVNKNLP